MGHLIRLQIGAVALIVILCGAAPRPAAALDAETAQKLVDCAVKDSLQTFAGRQMTPDEARVQLARLLDTYVDMQFQSEQILGRFWTTASPVQRREFSDLLGNFIVAAYGGRMNDIPADVQITVGGVDQDRDRFIVHSRAGAGEDISMPVDWVVAATSTGKPVIADVIVNGVGLNRMRQDEFAAIIRSNGGNVEGLMAPIRTKIRSLRGAS